MISAARGVAFLLSLGIFRFGVQRYTLTGSRGASPRVRASLMPRVELSGVLSWYPLACEGDMTQPPNPDEQMLLAILERIECGVVLASLAEKRACRNSSSRSASQTCASRRSSAVAARALRLDGKESLALASQNTEFAQSHFTQQSTLNVMLILELSLRQNLQTKHYSKNPTSGKHGRKNDRYFRANSTI